jgi:hypothetical protein
MPRTTDSVVTVLDSFRNTPGLRRRWFVETLDFRVSPRNAASFEDDVNAHGAPGL